MKNEALHRCGIVAMLSLGALVSTAMAQRDAGPPTLNPRDAVVSAMDLEDGRVLALPIEDMVVGTRFSLDLPMGPRGEMRRVDFGSHDVRAAGFQLVEDRGAEGLVSIDPGPVRTLEGRAPEEFGAVIRGSLLEDGLHAVFRWPDGRIQWIEPVGAHVDGFAADLHVLYDNDAIPPSGGICGTPAPIMGPRGPDADDAPPLALLGGGSVFCAELACDADYEYYQSYGSSSASVQARIELIITASNAQYESQTAIRHEITQILVRTTASDPYTSNAAETLLCQFITEWTNNQAGVSRDVAHLFTGRSINGGTIGIAADLGDICDTVGACSGPILYDGAYCLAQSDCCGSLGCATDLTTHELGHLWDAFHCNCTGNTMNPFITCSNSFASSSINSIVNHRDSRSCLDICDGDGGGGDGGYCAATCTDTSYEFVASLSMPDAGLSNPSGSSGYADYTALTATVSPGSVQPLDITNGDPQWTTDLLAVYIDWNADEDFDDAGENVANATGTGPYSLSFTVPAGQPEGPTRMRVRIHDGEFDAMSPCGNATYGEVEDYTIDVVIVKEPCTGDVNGDGQVNGADLGLLLGSWGACPTGCPADLNDDGQVNGADLGLMLGAWGVCP